MVSQEYQSLLIQAEAALRVATRKVSGNIWPFHKLEEAQAHLNALKNQAVKNPSLASKNNISTSQHTSTSPQTNSTATKPTSLDQSTVQVLIREAQSCSRRLHEYSNLLHCTTGAEKVALLRTISIETVKKESAWSKYYYYKRNGKEEVEPEITTKQEATVLNSTEELLRLEKEKTLLMQSRSRFKARLDRDPLTEKQRISVEEKYHEVDMQVKSLQQKIAALKF